MKLLNFSPWQHAKSSIPSASEDGTPVSTKHSLIVNVNPNSNVNTRKKKGKNDTRQPNLILTSPHQICILGHDVNKKENNHSLMESKSRTVISPEWVYTSRPSSRSSFIPNTVQDYNKSSDHKHIPVPEPVSATLDPNSRTIFALQNYNSTLCLG